MAGCTLDSNVERPSAPVAERYLAATDSGLPRIQPEWWTAFGSTELDALMAEAVAYNLDIAAAV
ncbi:MAG: RND transporter, partial [Alphaproteobacteria bacterium]